MKMNKTAAIISACVLTFGLSACSSNYVMHTNDGRSIVSEGKPTTDNDTHHRRWRILRGCAIGYPANRPARLSQRRDCSSHLLPA